MSLRDNRYNNALSALTYGLRGLVYSQKINKLYSCIMSIHEQYINILHVIIAEKASYLLKLHEIYNISDNEHTTQTKLKEFNIHHYLILYTQALDSFTFAFRTQFEKVNFKIEIILFVRQAKNYYDRMNEFDPFKAEAMMTFLQADKDGGNLLDIAEIQNILSEMKIYKPTEQILHDIQEINKILYEQQKLKRPSEMTNTELNQLGFQYLLRFYSIKEDLTKIFKEYCSQYKIQSRNNKVSLVDVVRYNQNPIMSASQLRQFYEKMLFQNLTEEECLKIIESFPVYDAEGKQKAQRQQLINFNNFCSLLSSRRNSAFFQQKKQFYMKMTNPLTDYYISTDFSDYSHKGTQQGTKINHFELSLKRGVRCLLIVLGQNKNKDPFVANASEKPQSLDQILRIISQKGFQFNHYPIILKIEHDGLSKIGLDRTAKAITTVFDAQLHVLPHNYLETQFLPSPVQLMKKVLIMAHVNPKLFKVKEKQLIDESMSFFRLVSIFESKLDFQRKGQFAWNFVTIQDSKAVKLEDVEDENMSNYTKKIIVQAGPTQDTRSFSNKNSSTYLRMGIQLIGLTFNNINEQNYYLQSLFAENGGSKSGYLLKPEWMCVKNPKNLYAKNFDSPLFQLHLKVLSGQNCIINNHKNEQKVTVEVYLRGNRKQQQNSKKFISLPQNPCYYIQFNLDSIFTVYCLDLAVLVFLVRSHQTKTILSGRAIPVRHLHSGLHPVNLMGDHFKEGMTNYLFIHSQHKDVPKKNTAFLENSL